MGQGRIRAGGEDRSAQEPDGILRGHVHHRPAVGDLPRVDPGVDEVHGFEAPEVGVVGHPAAADPGDVVVGEDDVDAEAARFERVLEVGPRADPRSGDRIRVRADVLEKPLLGQDLRPEHGFGVGVIIAEAHPYLGNEVAVGDGRDDSDAIGRLEAPRLFDALAAGGQLLDRNADLDHVARRAARAGHVGIPAVSSRPSGRGDRCRDRSRRCSSRRTPRRPRRCRRPGTSAGRSEAGYTYLRA